MVQGLHELELINFVQDLAQVKGLLASYLLCWRAVHRRSLQGESKGLKAGQLWEVSSRGDRGTLAPGRFLTLSTLTLAPSRQGGTS